MPRISELVARAVMRTDLVVAQPDQRLSEIRHRLFEAHISGMPVVDGGRLVGIITRSDLGRIEDLLETLDGEVADEQQWLADQADGFAHPAPGDYQGFRRRLAELRVRDAMRAQVVTCTADTPLGEVCREMVRHHVHRVVVVDGPRAVGIISTLDVVGLVGQEPATA